MKVEKSAFSQTNILCRTAIRKQIAIWKFQFQKIKRHEFLCFVCNFGEIRSSNPRIYAVKIENFLRYSKTRHFISEYPKPIITNFTGLVGLWVRMIIPVFVSRQLNFGVVRRHHQKRPLLIALAFDNGLANREVDFKRLNGNNPATLCKNLVNFRLIISEFTLLKRAIVAAIGTQFDDRSSFVTLAFRNRLEYRNFDLEQ